MNKYVLGIDGMKCGGCEDHVQDIVVRNDIWSSGANCCNYWSFLSHANSGHYAMGFSICGRLYDLFVAEEMIPEMASEGHDHFGVWSFIIGFVIMFALDCIQF